MIPALPLDSAIVVAKATAILFAAFVTTALMRRSAAASRHFVWAIALGAVCGIALLAPWAPRLVIPLPIAAPTPTAYVSVVPGSDNVTYAPQLQAGVRDVVAPRVTLPAWIVRHLASLAGTAWLAGLLLFLARCVAGHVAVHRLVHRGRRDWTDDTYRIVNGIVMQLGIRRPVALVTASVTTPVTSGCFHPVIIVPIESHEWSAERWRVVLTHELAHVARHDYLSQLVAAAAQALFWFHPLVWLALLRLRTEAEHAADDHVLCAGHSPVHYATELLGLARSERHVQLEAATVGMIRHSHLEGRLRAMLDATRPRTTVPPLLRVAVVIASVVVLVPLAGMRTRLAAAQQPPRAVRAAGQAPDSTSVRTITAHPGEMVVMTLQTGGTIHVRHGADNEVRLTTGYAGRDWRDTRVEFYRSDTAVAIDGAVSAHAPNSSTALTFDVAVPRDVDLRINSAGGAITIDGASGSFRGHTGGGEIRLGHAIGEAHLSTGGGDIVVSESTLDGTMRTGSGHIALQNVSGNLVGTAESADAAPARVTVRSRRGDDPEPARPVSTDMVVDDRGRPVAVTTGSASGNPVRVETGSSASARAVTRIASDDAESGERRPGDPAQPQAVTVRDGDRGAVTAAARGGITIIAGKVVDADGRGIEGVTVTAVGSNTRKVSTTNGNGEYRIIFNDGGSTYRVSGHRRGFADATNTITRTDIDDRVVLDFVLRADSTQLGALPGSFDFMHRDGDLRYQFTADSTARASAGVTATARESGTVSARTREPTQTYDVDRGRFARAIAADSAPRRAASAGQFGQDVTRDSTRPKRAVPADSLRLPRYINGVPTFCYHQDANGHLATIPCPVRKRAPQDSAGRELSSSLVPGSVRGGAFVRDSVMRRR